MLLGRVATIDQSGLSGVDYYHWYQALYAQDTWRVTSRVTVNAGLRWEPFFSQNLTRGANTIFDGDLFRRNVRSTVFHNAPAGFINLAAAPPYGNRTLISDPAGLFDDPYRDIGGNPHPIDVGPDTVYPVGGTLSSMDPDINAPRVQSWNVSIEQQIGTNWGASVSYLGSYSDRLWGLVALNPGVYLGLGPCTIQGVPYPVCTTNNNLNQRRVLSVSGDNPASALLISDDVYGEKTLASYLNRAAFAQPASGAFGTHKRNSITGPGFWKIDLAVSRLVSLASTQNLELRVEVFNLFNNFNWGLPNTNFISGTFGRITTSAGDPRIMQFGIKYAF
jgi:hypothetical protein